MLHAAVTDVAAGADVAAVAAVAALADATVVEVLAFTRLCCCVCVAVVTAVPDVTYEVVCCFCN